MASNRFYCLCHGAAKNWYNRNQGHTMTVMLAPCSVEEARTGCRPVRHPKFFEGRIGITNPFLHFVHTLLKKTFGVGKTINVRPRHYPKASRIASNRPLPEPIDTVRRAFSSANSTSSGGNSFSNAKGWHGM